MRLAQNRRAIKVAYVQKIDDYKLILVIMKTNVMLYGHSVTINKYWPDYPQG